jgi:hypothetical protein
MMRAHQPGSQPIDIPETIPNPAVPQPVPVPSPAPKQPIKVPAPQNDTRHLRAQNRPTAWSSDACISPAHYAPATQLAFFCGPGHALFSKKCLCVAAAAGDCQAGTAFAFDNVIGLRRARLLLSVGVGLLARFAVLDLGCAISITIIVHRPLSIVAGQQQEQPTLRSAFSAVEQPQRRRVGVCVDGEDERAQSGCRIDREHQLGRLSRRRASRRHSPPARHYLHARDERYST